MQGNVYLPQMSLSPIVLSEYSMQMSLVSLFPFYTNDSALYIQFWALFIFFQLKVYLKDSSIWLYKEFS